MDCAWAIHVSDGTAILAFTAFHTEQSFDFVHVYDGATDSAPLLATFTGSSVLGVAGAPRIVVGTSSDLFVRFTSDFSNVKSGFEGTWYSTSGSADCEACEAGKFSPAGAPGCQGCAQGSFTGAPNSGSCTPCPAGKYSTGVSNTECIACVAGTYSAAAGAALCDSCPAGKFSTSDSDACTDCAAGKFSMPSTIQPVAPTAQCKGLKVETGTTGTISDGPGDYDRQMDCSWRIAVNSGVATLHFTSFHVEDGYDFVDVYDGSDASASLIGTYTGSLGTFTLASTSTTMFVHFRTDVNSAQPGFQADWSSQGGSAGCAACPLGSVSLAGSTTCTECAAGQFANADSDLCMLPIRQVQYSGRPRLPGLPCWQVQRCRG